MSVPFVVCAHVSVRETSLHKELRDLCAHGFQKRMSDFPGFGVKGRYVPSQCRSSTTECQDFFLAPRETILTDKPDMTLPLP